MGSNFSNTITALAEAGQAPESIYLALGMSIADWARLKAELLRAEMITAALGTVSLTEAGQALASRLGDHAAIDAKRTTNPTARKVDGRIWKGETA